MSNTIGNKLKLTIFGQSHAPCVGAVIEGLPAGMAIDTDRVRAFMARRAPGGELSTARREADEIRIVAGLNEAGRTCGAPLCAVIENADARPGDYEALRDLPRPGHADYTARVKYFGHQDRAGGGHLSGRLTAPLCAAGGICLQLLARSGISVISRIAALGGVEDAGELAATTADADFPTVDDARGRAMRARIAEAAAEGDSLGGIVECKVLGLPAGLGDPVFGGMENRIAALLFGIPAVKGVEFGAGFAAAGLRGSEMNDPFRLREGAVVTETNHAGGILGGITNGMPLVFRMAVKPTPSIGREQRSVDLAAGRETVLRITGRHDPCIVPRAVPCVEAAAAISVTDALLGRRKERN
jgi:chorismate synthase